MARDPRTERERIEAEFTSTVGTTGAVTFDEPQRTRLQKILRDAPYRERVIADLERFIREFRRIRDLETYADADERELFDQARRSLARVKKALANLLRQLERSEEMLGARAFTHGFDFDQLLKATYVYSQIVGSTPFPRAKPGRPPDAVQHLEFWATVRLLAAGLKASQAPRSRLGQAMGIVREAAGERCEDIGYSLERTLPRIRLVAAGQALARATKTGDDGMAILLKGALAGAWHPTRKQASQRARELAVLAAGAAAPKPRKGGRTP
jgi:hypothetical protein